MTIDSEDEVFPSQRPRRGSLSSIFKLTAYCDLAFFLFFPCPAVSDWIRRTRAAVVLPHPMLPLFSSPGHRPAPSCKCRHNSITHALGDEGRIRMFRYLICVTPPHADLTYSENVCGSLFHDTLYVESYINHLVASLHIDFVFTRWHLHSFDVMQHITVYPLTDAIKKCCIYKILTDKTKHGHHCLIYLCGWCHHFSAVTFERNMVSHFFGCISLNSCCTELIPLGQAEVKFGDTSS